MRTRKIQITLLILATLALSSWVRQGEGSGDSEDQLSARNLGRDVGHSSLRRVPKLDRDFGPSVVNNVNERDAARLAPQKSNRNELQAVLSDVCARQPGQSNLSLSVAPSFDQTPNRSRIQFLDLRMKDDTITLISACHCSGTVKASRSGLRRGPLEYEVLNSKGELLWRDSIEDPSMRKFEYVDSLETGNLKDQQIRLDESEFALKFPWNPQARQVRFYRRSTLASVTEQSAERTLLGSVDLPVREKALQ